MGRGLRQQRHMSEIKAKFEAGLTYVQSGEGPELSQHALLKFYGLYKQAGGPCTSEAPSRLNVVAYEKWKAHKALGEMDKDHAMEKYLEELERIAPNWDKEANDSPVILEDDLKGDLKLRFEAGLKYIQSGDSPELSQNILLQFYGLYKQATDGPCTKEAPSRLNVV